MPSRLAVGKELPRGAIGLLEPDSAESSTGLRSSAIGGWRDGSHRLALLVFAVVAVIMFVAVLVLGRHKWFVLDEWEFLAGRTAGSAQDLLRPTIGHWMTLPILVYRGLYAVFGLRTYVPYEAVLLALHLTAAGLLRVIMRRAGVGPWIATVAASLFVLFGAGYENLIWAVQIGFVGSLVLGLTQLLLVGHDEFDRRDWLALLAGVAGLMCSGVGVVLAIVVGLATLARRGWRMALFHTAPLAALYLTWWLGFARHYYRGLGTGVPDLTGLLHWVETSVAASFQAMGQVPGVSIVLAILLAVGLPLAWGRLNWETLRVRATPTAALLIGAFVFVAVAGWQRELFHQFSVPSARYGRYMHIFVALVIPALAVAVNAIVRRWRILLPLALAPLVIGIPGNLEALSSPAGLYNTNAEIAFRQSVLSLVSVPVVHGVPRSLRVESLGGGAFAPWPPPSDVTIGWLLDQQAAGKLPRATPLDPTERADITVELALHQTTGSVGVDASAPGTAPLVQTSDTAKGSAVLVDSRGRTLYSLVSGVRPVPCAKACGAEWSPLLAPIGSRPISADPGVPGLGRTPDGIVTEWGFPLYRFLGDRVAGDVKGNGVAGRGGLWRPVPGASTCRKLVTPVTRQLERGQSIGIAGGTVGVIYVTPPGNSDLVTFDPAHGNKLVALAGPLTLELLPTLGSKPVTACMGNSSGDQPSTTSAPARSLTSPTALVTTSNDPHLGTILVDSKGFPLYALTNSDRPATCKAAGCSRIWPLLRVPRGGNAAVKGSDVPGLSMSRSGTVVTYMGFPLARYLGDASQGIVNGNGVRTSGGTWYVLRPGHAPGPA